MIYSRWQPDVGGYEYYETSEAFTINDDLPTPRLPKGELGVASVEAGRVPPASAVYVGSGEDAVGLIAPLDETRIVRRTSLGADDDGIAIPLPSLMLGAALGLATGYLLWRK